MLSKIKNVYAIPGWGFATTIFTELKTNKFDIVGLDYMGSRASSIHDITAIIAAKVPNHSILLGWSFGGMLAIKLAAQHPSKVRRLMLLSSQPKLCVDGQWLGISQTNANQFLEQFEKSPQQQMKYFARLLCYPSRSPTLRQIIQKHMIDEAQTELNSLLKMLFSEDLRQDYSKLGIDILHLICEQDVVLKQHASQLQNLNHRVKVISLEDAGHADFLVSPSRYSAAIEQFINHDKSD